MTRNVLDIVYVHPSAGTRHRVAYRDDSGVAPKSGVWLTTTLEREMTKAGIYCLGVWPAPFFLPGSVTAN